MNTTDKDHARQQAKAQLESIQEMVLAMSNADSASSEEDARQTIQEDALSVEVRSGWHSPGDKVELGEFNILLCTGGPAVRIIGGLSEHHEPESARLEYQDWGTPWTDYSLTSEEEETLLAYASCFYFGE